MVKLLTYFEICTIIFFTNNPVKFFYVTAVLPTRVIDIGDLVPNNVGDGSMRKIPSFLYRFAFPSDYIQSYDQAKTSKLPLCGADLYPGFVKYVFRNLFQSDEYHEVPIKQADQGAFYFDYPNIMTCNPWKDDSCDECKTNNPVYKVVWYLYRDDSNERLALSECLLIRSKDCGLKTCQNGQYATDFLHVNSHGKVVSTLQCQPCPPGTWLTCIEDATCSYTVPERSERFDNGKSFYPSTETPVGSCFSCPSAANKIHYAKTPINKITGSFQLGGDKPLPWYCPGGDSPPLNCTAPFVGANKDFTGCVCAQGWFKVGDNDCQICQPGYMCPNGESIECEDNYYQDKEGATSCTLCHQDGFASGCGPGTSLRKCVGRFKKEPPACINCNICRRSYLTNPAGRIECYDQ